MATLEKNAPYGYLCKQNGQHYLFVTVCTPKDSIVDFGSIKELVDPQRGVSKKSIEIFASKNEGLDCKYEPKVYNLGSKIVNVEISVTSGKQRHKAEFDCGTADDITDTELQSFLPNEIAKDCPYLFLYNNDPTSGESISIMAPKILIFTEKKENNPNVPPDVDAEEQISVFELAIGQGPASWVSDLAVNSYSYNAYSGMDHSSFTQKVVDKDKDKDKEKKVKGISKLHIDNPGPKAVVKKSLTRRINKGDDYSGFVIVKQLDGDSIEVFSKLDIKGRQLSENELTTFINSLKDFIATI